jgi:hypothetical protein
MHLLFLLLVMVDLSAYAFAPPPAPRRQVPSSTNADFLVPSHVYVKLKAASENIVNVHDDVHDSATSENVSLEAPDPTVAAPTKKKKSIRRQANRFKLQRFGNLPDIHWRAISMDHLRMHPLFDALPEYIDKLESLEDVRYFRQDTWQWDALHAGRCTTSQASAALGFLEPEAASLLQIPKSWQRGGVSAYHRLSGKAALRTLEDMQKALLVTGETLTDMQEAWHLEDETVRLTKKKELKVWSDPPSSNFPFAAKYAVRTSPADREHRKKSAANMGMMSTKMSWGNAQEATALLTALNYFHQSDPGVRMEEVGMCGAGLALNNTFLLGASPDGLIRHSNGTKEVLEVKNHCPFYSTKRGYKNPDKDFAIKSFPFSEPYLQPLYVPQLMMEMLCTDCKSAVMVRQTATTGALIIRVYRNDDWINEMLYWLKKFQTQYVQEETPPPTNFFWDDDRYRAFVRHTNELAGTVEVLSHVEHKDIQRMLGTDPSTASLFLDHS